MVTSWFELVQAGVFGSVAISTDLLSRLLVAGAQHGAKPHCPAPGRAPATLPARRGPLCFQTFLGSGSSGWLLLNNNW